MHETVPESKGLVVKVGTYRKGKHGNTGQRRPVDAGRKGKTGKTAVVKNEAGETVGTFKAGSFKALAVQLRRQYNIHPSVVIAKYGETRF